MMLSQKPAGVVLVGGQVRDPAKSLRVFQAVERLRKRRHPGRRRGPLRARHPARGGGRRLGHRRVRASPTSSGWDTRASLSSAVRSTRPPSRTGISGYGAALNRAGVPMDDALVVQTPMSLTGGSRAVGRPGRRAAPASRPSSPRRTRSRSASISGLRSRGLRVPQDVSVVGMDDVPMASHADPPLTTIHVPARELGCSAWHLLSAIRDGVDFPEAQCVPFELVVRDSTAPPDRRLVREPASPRQAGRGRAKGSVTTEWPASAPKNSSPTIASTSFMPRSRSARTSASIYDTAEGIRLWDTEGKMYLDASSQMVSCNLGHGRREIIEAAQKQLDKLQHVGQYYGHSSTPMVECAMKLADDHSRRPRPLLVHVGRRRVDRRGHQAGAALLDRRGPARQAEGRQPLHELPRHRQRAHEHDRHPGHAGRLRPARRRATCRSRPTTATGARSASSTRRATCAARGTSRPSSKPRAPRTSRPSSPSPNWAPPVFWCRPDEYWPLIREICDEVRRRHDRRRGHVRVLPHRHHVLHRPLERRPRRDRHVQGHHQRLPALRRGGLQRQDLGRAQGHAAHAPVHLQRLAGPVRRRHRRDRRLRRARTSPRTRPRSAGTSSTASRTSSCPCPASARTAASV